MEIFMLAKLWIHLFIEYLHSSAARNKLIAVLNHK